MSFKICKESYWKKTPKKWRKIGDTMLAISTFLATGGLFEMDALKDIFTASQMKGFVISTIGIGVVSKFLTNFFNEDDETIKKD
jgi:hypothetical protein